MSKEEILAKYCPTANNRTFINILAAMEEYKSVEPQPIKEPLSFEEFIEKYFEIHRGKTMSDEMVGDFKLKYDGYLIGCKEPT